jgi:hypothetical protein
MPRRAFNTRRLRLLATSRGRYDSHERVIVCPWGMHEESWVWDMMLREACLFIPWSRLASTASYRSYSLLLGGDLEAVAGDARQRCAPYMSQPGFTTMAVRCWQVSTLGVGDEKEDGREGNWDCIEGRRIQRRYKNGLGCCERLSCLTARWCQDGRALTKLSSRKSRRRNV